MRGRAISAVAELLAIIITVYFTGFSILLLRCSLKKLEFL